ncbi:MAG: replicative DNA helicase [Actinomycetota bacterium]|nr:replicative DNA helicase [Actinomycetota bacterium]
MVQSIDDARRQQRRAGASRVPPHNLEAEESLLGAMLLSRDAIVAAVEAQLGAADFYKPAHGHVYEAITSLYAQGEPVDPVTVAEELRRADLLEAVGGGAVLISLQSSTPATSNATRYASIVEEYSLLRRLISVAGEIAEIGYGLPDDVTAAVDAAEALVFDVAQRRVTDSMAPIRDLLERHLDHIEALYERGEDIIGVPTGFIDLDQQLAGLQPSNLVIIGGRPGMGKTSFGLGIAAHAAMEGGAPVLVFSLEMSHLELTQRLLCSEARVDATRMRNGRLLETDWPKISHAVGRLADSPIHIDDNPHLTVMEIRAKARRLKSRQGLGLIIIDYLQLMTGRNSAENRQVEVSEISRGLKILARELEVPVIALSQLSRNLENRSDKRPVLADLRESGCMPASTRVMRADNGEEISLGELVLSQAQPLVWSVDDHQKLVPARLLKAFPSGIKPVFELRLASGRSVTASANHPFLTIDGWARLDALEVGSFIAVPRRLPTPLHPGSDWSDDELALLAHLIGDGSLGPSFKYATTDSANKQVVEELARRLFGIETESENIANTWQLWFPSPYRLTHDVHHPMRNWLEPHGLWKSRSSTKFVPPSVFGLGDDQIALFLRHLWATDGSVTIARNARGPVVRTYYSTTSRRLALDVQCLLLRLGLRSTIDRSKKQRVRRPEDGVEHYRECFSVRIQTAASQARFLRIAGCHGQRGACIPKALAILDGMKPHPNVDLVPWPAAEIEEAAQSAWASHRRIAQGSYLLGTEDRPRRFSPDRLACVARSVGSEELANIAAHDLFWDQAIEVSAVGKEPTFDITVEGTHNFIANGVIAHNSLEQDSDVVIFLYRDELYNRDSADRGTAEVIVAKHRNGPTGSTQLAFLEQYTRFANMARGV